MTLPVLWLRESATALGSIRKDKGRLTLTANGRKLICAPATELLTHIASRIPSDKAHGKEAGTLALLFTTARRDRYHSGPEAAALMEAIGWRLDGGSLARAVLQWAHRITAVLDSLCGRADAVVRADVARGTTAALDLINVVQRAVRAGSCVRHRARCR